MPKAEELNESIQTSLVKFDTELKKSKDVESIELNQVEIVCYKLIDILKYVDNNTVVKKLDIFESVLVIIHKSLDADKNVANLLDILAILIWQVLVNDLTMIFPNVFDIFLQNRSYLEGIQSTDTNGLSNIIDRLFLLNHGFKDLIKQDSKSNNLQFIAFLNHLVIKYEENISKLTHLLNGTNNRKNGVSPAEPGRLNFQLTAIFLDIIELINVSVQRELSSLILTSHQCFLNNLVAYKENIDVSHYNKTLVDEILDLIADILIPKYYQTYIANTILLPPRNIHYQFFPPQVDSLSNSINFILQVLENGIHLHYLSLPTLTTNLLLTTQQFHESAAGDRLQLYSKFNSNSSKLSILIVLIYENYLISLNLLDDVSNLPANLINRFKSLLLPPLPKSNIGEEFTQNSKFTIQNYSNLQLSRIYCLDSLRLLIENELNSIDKLNQYSSNTVDHKISNSVIDSMLCSLCLGLISKVSNEELDILNLALNQLVYKIINNLMNIETKSVNYSLVWVSLLSIIDELCNCDFSVSPIFIQLFDYLAQNEMIKTKTVKEAVTDFMKKFYCDEPCLKMLLAFAPGSSSNNTTEILFGDLKSKYYPSEPVNSEQNVTKAIEPASLSSGAARRQSVHVDEYEKNRSFDNQ